MPDESKMPSSDSSTDLIRCRCDHYHIGHRPYASALDEGGCRYCACETFQLPEEPPLTPEEEEEAGFCVHPEGYEGECPCPPSCDCCAVQAAPSGEVTCGWNPVQATTDCDWDRDCPVHGEQGPNPPPPPPQPLRRPPYAVAYSADGHLYEAMLPGDAIVSAVDGALVIKHARFQIHGIVAVQPVINEESA